MADEKTPVPRIAYPIGATIGRATTPPQWEWERWLTVTETSLAPTPLLLFVRDRFDAMEALLRQLLSSEDLRDEMDAVRSMLAEIEVAKADPPEERCSDPACTGRHVRGASGIIGHLTARKATR